MNLTKINELTNNERYAIEDILQAVVNAGVCEAADKDMYPLAYYDLVYHLTKKELLYYKRAVRKLTGEELATNKDYEI